VITKPKYLIFVLLAFAGVLTGCLSKEEGSGDALTGTSPPPPPPPPAAGNTPPTISGNPAPAVSVGNSYQFAPSASDADGDSLTFSIDNLPPWASFNSANGQLTGSPMLSDVGMYENIVISVSDGSASTSLNSFSVEVVSQGTGSVTLSWTAPVENEDGTALTNLSGYVIYYGTQPGSYSQQIPIDNASVTTYVVEGLTPDTYYFAATAKNSQGVQSIFSNEAVKQVTAN
jgi:hypothetical protein